MLAHFLLYLAEYLVCHLFPVNLFLRCSMLGNIHGIPRSWFISTWLSIIIFSRGHQSLRSCFQFFLVFHFSYKPEFFPQELREFQLLICTPSVTYTQAEVPCWVAHTPGLTRHLTVHQRRLLPVIGSECPWQSFWTESSMSLAFIYSICYENKVFRKA